MASPRDMNLYYGPRVVVDPHILPEHHPGRIDGFRIGDNLRQDFSKVTAADWNNVLVRFTDRLPSSRPGLLLDVTNLRESRQARIVRGGNEWFNFLMQGTLPVGPRQLDRWSIGTQVLAVINMLPASSGEDIFQGNSREGGGNRNHLLAQMMHLSATHLLETQGLPPHYGRNYVHSSTYALATEDKWTGVIENADI